jgi:hypothetical protein
VQKEKNNCKRVILVYSGKGRNINFKDDPTAKGLSLILAQLWGRGQVCHDWNIMMLHCKSVPGGK